MPLYTYKAQTRKGKIIEDIVQAIDKKEAVGIVKTDKSLKVLTIKSIEPKISTLFGGKISVSEKASFCRFMATMLRAGLPLSEAVDVIRKETVNKRLKEVLFDVSFQIRKGNSLSSVLSKYKKDFDTFFLTMVKAGEESGTIDKSFDYLAKQLLASHELSQKVKGSLMYPAVIVVAMGANAVVMMVFVLPKLSDVFLSLNVDLPATTKLMLDLGKYIGENTIPVLIVSAFVGFLAFMAVYLRSTRKVLLKGVTKLPVISKVVHNIDVSRFSRTLSTLLVSGVPIMVALDVASGTLSQAKLAKTAKGFSVGVSEGKQLSELLVKSGKDFPSVMVQTIRAGEKSGSLGEVLEELAAFYEREVEFSLKRMTSLIEPVLMLVIGVAVGAMVLMMITPIYSIVGGLEGSF